MSANKRGLNKRGSKRAVKAASAPLDTGKAEPVEARESIIKYLEKATNFSEARNKNEKLPRKVHPKAPVGQKVLDMQPTPPLSLEGTVPQQAVKAARAVRKAPADTITLVKNVQLKAVAAVGTASHVCEPSAAINGAVVFYTGNWFAAVSTDGGTTFKFVDPFTAFPNPPGMRFCCDQGLNYIESIDTFVWVLQYKVDSSGKNIERIAYATTADVKRGSWRFFDITPDSLGQGAGISMDFPDLAVGQNMLYMTANCFQGGTWQASAVARISLSSFTSGKLSMSRAVSTTIPSLRVAQNCGTTAFFTGHKDTSTLEVFSWEEGSETPASKLVSVPHWSQRGFGSITPDGHNWLQGVDARHTGATLAGDELWFAWGSAKGGVNARPNPFVQIARINATAMTLIESINLWDHSSAIFYAALSTNANNEVGASYMIGGGHRFPTHVIGILTGTRRHVTTFASKRGPSDDKWGDFLTVRRNYPHQKLFCATGYSLQSGTGDSDATPNLTIFGRSSEV